MAVTLWFDDADADALHRQAEIEGRSVEDVARAALHEYLTRSDHRQRVEVATQDCVARYAPALRRLGDS